MSTAGVVAFLLAVVLDANALDWKWIEHAYPEDGFRVEFNAPVTIKRMRLTSKSSERVVRATRYMLDEGKRLYVVAASLNKDGVDLEEGVRRSFAGLECGVLLSDEPVAAPWGMGRALQARHCVDGTYRAQARCSGRWFYQVVALYKEAGGDVESARYFLDSFRVTR